MVGLFAVGLAAKKKVNPHHHQPKTQIGNVQNYGNHDMTFHYTTKQIGS